jgi:hypothetical protein
MSPPRRAAKIPSPCTIGGLLELLARPWTLHILWVLSHNGEMRFGVLRRQIEGISARVLTEGCARWKVRALSSGIMSGPSPQRSATASPIA